MLKWRSIGGVHFSCVWEESGSLQVLRSSSLPPSFLFSFPGTSSRWLGGGPTKNWSMDSWESKLGEVFSLGREKKRRMPGSVKIPPKCQELSRENEIGRLIQCAEMAEKEIEA